MAVDGKPAISESRVGDRAAFIAIANIRERIEKLEAALRLVASQANQSTFDIAQRNATLSNLQTQITNLNNAIDQLLELLQLDDGLVVLSSGQLITRVLEEGTNITITNPDGADGNPLISTTGGSGSYPFLTDNQDTDILTNDGLRIRTT